MPNELEYLLTAVCFAALLATSAEGGPITYLDLGGQWEVTACGSNDWFAATVAGHPEWSSTYTLVFARQ